MALRSTVVSHGTWEFVRNATYWAPQIHGRATSLGASVGSHKSCGSKLEIWLCAHSTCCTNVGPVGIPRTLIKQGTVAHICNCVLPFLRWGRDERIPGTSQEKNKRLGFSFQHPLWVAHNYQLPIIPVPGNQTLFWTLWSSSHMKCS